MVKNLIPAQRRELILENLAVNKVARLADLSEILGASEATVRRDLEKLEEKGLVERTHGGAILSHRLSREPDYQQRRTTHQQEKIAIGLLAASLIEDGDIVFINSGSTTTQLIHNIRSNADITVVTNNIFALLGTEQVGVDFLVLGGLYHPVSSSVAGQFTDSNLQQIYADKTFIGVDGLSLKYGCTFPAYPEVEMVRTMMERTRGDLTLLADHSKWGTISNYEVCKINRFHRLITDEAFDLNGRHELEDLSVEVLIAPVETNPFTE